MATPIQYYAEVAKKYGHVDPEDYFAIEEWFLNQFPKLPRKDKKNILYFLLSHNNELTKKPLRLYYPKKVPTPLVKDMIPLNSSMVNSFYRYLLNLVNRAK